MRSDELTGSPDQESQSQATHERTITVRPSGISFVSDVGETVMAAALRQGMRWPTVCQGNAQCAACAFLVDDGEENLSAVESDEASCLSGYVRTGSGDTRSVRLACRAQVMSGAVTIFKRGVRPPRATPG